MKEVKNKMLCKHRILRSGYCLILLVLTGLLCIMPACQPSVDKDGNAEKPDTEAEAETPPPKDETSPPDTEAEAETPDVPILHKADTLLLVKWDTYSYLARVTENTLENATEVPIHVFNEKARNALGSNIAIADVVTTREEPQNGWGTRKIALEYFDGTQWHYTMKALEGVDYYTLPSDASGGQRVEFANVRFDIISK